MTVVWATGFKSFIISLYMMLISLKRWPLDLSGKKGKSDSGSVVNTLEKKHLSIELFLD